LLALDEPTNHLDIAAREALENALTEYPGTLLFVTHDRYLVQKIATHLLYIERGKSYVFDRLSAFEEWLNTPTASPRSDVSTAQIQKNDRGAIVSATGLLSKNMKGKLQKEIAELESKIVSTEKELADLEISFQKPDPEINWESSHRRHAELKQILELLYEELAGRWELMG
jgi:ATP-binding cassette subfamily F protein 3